MRSAPLLACILTLAATGVVASEIEDLAWMAGHWRLENGTMMVEEGWFAPAGGSMLGMNRSVSEDRTTGFEYLRLWSRAGEIVLFANPGGSCPATEFVLTDLDGQRVVFRNPEHDFPQWIAYRREGDRLHAEIGGVVDGEKKKTGWVFELMP